MAQFIKSAKAIFLLSIVSLVSVSPLIFSSDKMNEHKVDVYVFANHLRWPENIAYDISELFMIITLTYTIWLLIPERRYKRYAMSFLIVALLGLPGYFLFYSKFVSLVFIPLLIGLLYLNYIRNGNEERNNVR